MTTENSGTVDPAAPKAPTRPGLAPGAVVGDRYEIVRLIGEGGMGTVYEARHKILGRPVAIKVLRPEVAFNEQLSARFLQEAKAAAELHHKNIVELTDYGVDGERPYMVMELLQGEDLGSLLKREGTLDVPRLVAIIDPVLRALAMAHERGVIHRDIKPENIFLVTEDEGGPTPKIVDFGIAKRQEESVQLTSANMALGTPAYMAPEQVMSSRTVTGAADQYAVGVTMYESLTGRNPYDADTLNAFIIAKATQDPEPLDRVRPDLDPRFVAVVMKTLARKPDDRYPTIAALREALAPFRTTSLRPPPAEVSSPSIPRPPSVPAAPSHPSLPAQPAAHVFDATLAPTPSGMVVPVPTPAKPPRSKLPWALGGVALAAVLGVGLAMALGSHGATEAPPADARAATNEPPPQPGQQEVQFSIEVEPRSALIRLDGEVIGTGRAAVVRPKDGRRHQLQLEAPGYVTVNEVLAADADVRLERELTQSAPSGTPPNNPPVGNVATAPTVHHGAHAQPQTTQPPQTPTQPPAQPQAPPAQPQTQPQPPTQPQHPRPHDPAHPTVDETNPFDDQR